MIEAKRTWRRLLSANSWRYAGYGKIAVDAQVPHACGRGGGSAPSRESPTYSPEEVTSTVFEGAGTSKRLRSRSLVIVSMPSSGLSSLQSMEAPMRS